MSAKNLLKKEYQQFQTILSEQSFPNEWQEEILIKIKDLEQPLIIMVVGHGNHGKSTVINHLLNEYVAPVSFLPKTWKIDLYATAAGLNEKAIIGWRDGHEIEFSIAKGQKKIVDEENLIKKNSQNEEPWRSDITQVTWKYQVDWLQEEMVIVDTPGFDQLRADTSFDKISLYDSKGILLAREDGFKYYYYRADVVLWCIRVDKLEDKSTLEKLQACKHLHKKIIGIITHCEKAQEHDFEIIKKKAKELYGEYLDEICLFMGKGDEKKKLSYINIIRKKIDDLLLNCGLQDMKIQSSQAYLENKKSEFAELLYTVGKDVLVENINKLEFITKNTNEEINMIINSGEKSIKYEIESIQNKLNDNIQKAWQLTEGNPDKFMDYIRYRLIDTNMIQNRMDKAKKDVIKRVLGIYASVRNINKWNTILAMGDNNTIVIEKPICGNISTVDKRNNNEISANTHLNLIESELFENSVKSVAAGLGVGLLLGPVGWVVAGVGVVASFCDYKQKIRKKCFNTAEIAVENYTKNMYEQWLIYANNLRNSKKRLLDEINKSFCEVTGDSVNKSKDRLMNFEQIYNSLKAYPQKPYKSFPYISDEIISVGRYYHINKISQNSNTKNICKSYLDKYILDTSNYVISIYKERLSNLDEEIIKCLESGGRLQPLTKTINKEVINRLLDKTEKNDFIDFDGGDYERTILLKCKQQIEKIAIQYDDKLVFLQTEIIEHISGELHDYIAGLDNEVTYISKRLQSIAAAIKKNNCMNKIEKQYKERFLNVNNISKIKLEKREELTAQLLGNKFTRLIEQFAVSMGYQKMDANKVIDVIINKLLEEYNMKLDKLHLFGQFL